MKFPRNEKILRSPFEMAPFAAVFFLLVIFVVLSALLPTSGVPLHLPVAADLPGLDKPSVAVAVDSTGRIYFKNQIVNEAELKFGLRNASKNSRDPLILVIHADKSVTLDQITRLALLARSVGIEDSMLATLPPMDASVQ